VTEGKHEIRINVPALARVEGEGALDVVISEGGITDLKLRIYEPPRYFEKFLEGRMYHEVPDIVARICGICPVAYQMTAVQALESICDVTITPWIRDMRQVLYCGEWIQSHSLHIHLLALPDFLGFNNIMEMASKYPQEVQRGMRLQSVGNELMSLLGGRSVHPIGIVPGGFSSAPDVKAVGEMVETLAVAINDAEQLLRWLATLDLPVVEQQFVSAAMHTHSEYPLYEGRITSSHGLDIDKKEFAEHFSEFQVPHSTALHCLLDGQPYLVGPLARLNLNHARLPDHLQVLLDELGIQFPVRNMFCSVIARVVEVCYALHEAHRLLDQYRLPDLAAVDVIPCSGVGFGCTEAPRGILWHRYELDDAGRIVSARIVPPTSQNQARIEEDLRQSLTAHGLESDEESLRIIGEKVIRNYDPCISCATHFLKLSVSNVSALPLKGPLQDEPEEQDQNAARAAVIGVGSSHGADRLGYEVVQRLEKIDSLQQADVVVHYLDHFDMSFIKHIETVEQIIFVDAVQSGRAMGSLIMLNGKDIVAPQASLSSHEVGLCEYILWLQAMLGDRVDISVVGLDTGNDEDWCYQEKDVQGLLASILEMLTG